MPTCCQLHADAPETKQSCTASKGGDYLCGELAAPCYCFCCSSLAVPAAGWPAGMHPCILLQMQF
jgi:hypothetical protein